MQNLKNLLFTALVVMFSTCAAAQELTEKSVSALLAQVDKAAVKKDVETVSKALSEFAEITVIISASGKTQKMTMTKAQYISSLRSAWAMTTNYTYRRANEKIVIKGRSANVNSDVFEHMVINGQSLRTSSKESATIELVNGSPLVTKVVATTSL